jgi:alpha-mannosidase II
MVNGIIPRKYNLSGQNIDIYLVPHTHLDPGWIETFEDYYTKKVKIIIQNVIKALKSDPNKKYTWCEISFLERFWNDPKVNNKEK